MKTVEVIEKLVSEALDALKLPKERVAIDHPTDLLHGDYSTNVALALSKKVGENPRTLSAKIADVIKRKIAEFPEIEAVEVAGAGFVNFRLSRSFFEGSIKEINSAKENFGKGNKYVGQKIMVEYTDPNPFKEFHIGHLMDNAIGESISRLFDFQGAEVLRACWQGDVGMHVAKAIWGMIQKEQFLPKESDSIENKAKFLGEAYAYGAGLFETDDVVKKEITDLNKKIFGKTDEKINKLYETGRTWSLNYFELIYQKLGTKFDYYFFEGKEGIEGKSIVEEFLKKGVFEESEGAVVFKGEKYGLHTRVFINSQGLPTYEAKELGLNKKKFELEKLDRSIIVTANEINDYFKVLLKVMELIYPDIAKSTKHLSHGFLRLPEGKMSSRTGKVITGESLIKSVEVLVLKKLEGRELDSSLKNQITEAVAIGAIKYSILRQGIGGDIIFDFDKSISFEGDSGPYLQYSYARAKSVLRKAEEEDSRLKIQDSRIGNNELSMGEEEMSELVKRLYRFPEIVEKACREYEPHHVVTYLTELSASFNSFYANNPILEAGEAKEWRISLTKAFAQVMENGLKLLAISPVERM